MYAFGVIECHVLDQVIESIGEALLCLVLGVRAVGEDGAIDANDKIHHVFFGYVDGQP